jgi:hypothetical protein
MAWQRISRKAPRNHSKRPELERRVQSGEEPSYVDEHGNRMVWGSRASAPPTWSLELVAKVRQELADLKRELFEHKRAA